MDRKPSNPETDSWVDDRLASLAPAPEWTPNAHRALNQILNGQKAAGPRWASVGMTATILATTVVVLALLPWQRLWTPEPAQKSVTAAATTAKHQETAPQTPPASAAQVEAAKAAEAAQQSPLHHPETVQAVESERARLEQIEHFKRMQDLDLQARADYEKLEAFKRMQAEARTAAEYQLNGVTGPKVVSQVLPEYTDAARQAKILGTVELIVTIRADGSVQFERVKSGLGYGLDEKAREAVEKWQFTPGMKDGVPVATMISIAVNFTLR